MSANAYVLKEIFEKLNVLTLQHFEVLEEIRKLKQESGQWGGCNSTPSPWALKKKEAEDQLKERIVKQQIEALQGEKASKPEILGVNIEDFAKYLQEMNEERAIEILDELFAKISKK